MQAGSEKRGFLVLLQNYIPLELWQLQTSNYYRYDIITLRLQQTFDHPHIQYGCLGVSA